MDTNIFLCVDGGGTKTEALLADTSGNILGIGRAAGSNAYSVGKEAAFQCVINAINSALPSDRVEDVRSAWLFIPGFSQCLPLPLPFETMVLGDEASAYYGAMGEPDGITVLAGTGSFAVSYNKLGRQTCVGGWGPMLGDEGSGYDVGRRAIRYTLKEYDAGNTPSNLSKAVLAHYQTNAAHSLVRVIYQGGCDRKYMARLCLIVGDHAKAGEKDALNIVEETSFALCELAVSLKTRLKLNAAPVALTGGVSGLGDVLLKPFEAHVSAAGLIFRVAKYPPSVGGILYAYMKTTGHTASENLAESYYKSYMKWGRI